MSLPDAKKAAEAVLSKYWILDKFPIDPVFIANQLGISVMKTEIDDNISGIIVKQQGKDPYIFLNEKDSDNRKGFTCAHELGHFYLNLSKNTYESIDYRSMLAQTGTDPHEIFANNFAANLLMPENELRKLVKINNGIELLSHFGVSGDAMKYRLINLGPEHPDFPKDD